MTMTARVDPDTVASAKRNARMLQRRTELILAACKIIHVRLQRFPAQVTDESDGFERDKSGWTSRFELAHDGTLPCLVLAAPANNVSLATVLRNNTGMLPPEGLAHEVWIPLS